MNRYSEGWTNAFQVLADVLKEERRTMATAPVKNANQQKPGSQPGKATPAAAKPVAAKPAAVAATKSPAAKTGELVPKETAQTPIVRQATAVATADNLPADLPAHIRRDTNRGSENVEQSDLVIPRIELVQALSKCLEEKNEGQYIEGAKAGMLYNSVTRQLYGPNLFFIPVYYMKQYLAWRDRKEGGGFAGAFDTLAECEAAIAKQEDPENYEAIETGQQVVLVVDPENNYATEEAIISCARTKFKVSRQLNSTIRIHGMDRFSRYYELFGTDEQNSNGEAYKNFGFRLVDWTPEAPYRKAEALYESITAGNRKVVADANYDDVGTGEPPVGGATDQGPSEY